MAKTKTTKQFPARACCATIGTFVIGDNGDDAKTAPIRIMARSSEPIEHAWFGLVIHDMDGMVHKDRIVLDYCHDDGQLVGYGNKFEFDAERNLIISGALTPFKDDRASEIISKARAGVPYEASIDFRPRGTQGVKLEEIVMGERVMVNGREYDGPIMVVRAWPLNAVAICPHGADDRTAAYLQTEETSTVEVEIMGKEIEKTDVEKAAELAAVEAAKVAEAAKLAEAKKGVETPGDGTPAKLEPKAEGVDKHAEFKSYVDEFGATLAAEYFAVGTSLEDARKKYAAHLKVENERLAAENQKLSASKTIEGAEFDPAGDADGMTLSAGEDQACVDYAKSTGQSVDKMRETRLAMKKRGGKSAVLSLHK